MTFDSLVKELKAKLDNKGFLMLAELHLEQTTDVMIQLLSQLFGPEADREKQQKEFQKLWFPFLRQ